MSLASQVLVDPGLGMPLSPLVACVLPILADRARTPLEGRAAGEKALLQVAVSWKEREWAHRSPWEWRDGRPVDAIGGRA